MVEKYATHMSFTSLSFILIKVKGIIPRSWFLNFSIEVNSKG